MRPLIQENEIADILVEGSSQLGVPLPAESIPRMIRHLELLLQWGSRINLTALSDPVEIAVLHFLDSLTVFKVFPFASGLRVIDVGTGAGFPGMVLATADASINVTLLDRDPKKIVFLKHVAHHLGIMGITFLNHPLEVLLQAKVAPEFDAAVSRAVSSDPDFMDSLHLVLSARGSLITMAGPRSGHEGLDLKEFTLTDVWEGFLPFISKFRRVSRYSVTRLRAR